MHAPAIRTGRPSDLAAIHALETQVFESDRLTRAALRGHLASVREPVIVAELDGRLVGYALVVMRRDSAAARLYSLGVSGDAAGRGVGSALLAECEARAAAAGARSMRLEVRRDNRAAIALYERRGYRRFGRYDDFYTDGEAAWRYEKRLLAPAAGVVAPAPVALRAAFRGAGAAACLIAALRRFGLAAADDPAAQAALWREIAPFPSDRRGGGAEAAGIALAAHRRGVATRLHVTRDRAIVGEAGAPSASSRAAALVAGDWRRQATDLAIPTTELPLMLEALERTLAGGGLAIVNFGARRGRWLLVHGCDGHDLAAIDPEARGDPATTVALASGLAPGPGFAVAREAALLERVRP